MKILILKPSSLGDVVQALPVLRLLKRHRPGSEIYWWIDSALAPLLEGDPDLTGVVRFERRRWASPLNWGGLWRSIQWVREQRFDLVIDLQCLARSAIFGWLANGERFVGLDEPREAARSFYDLSARRASFHTHAVDWYLSVLKLLDVPVNRDFTWLPIRTEVADAVRRKWPVAEGPWVMFQPGARWRTKRWPIESYEELLRRLLAAYPKVRVGVLGGAADMELGARLAGVDSRRCLDLTARTTLSETVEWIRASSLMVTNDTGPMHIAAALRTPLIALFGPTEPRRTGPYGQLHQALQLDLDCVPCLRGRCRRRQEMECLRSLPVSRVMFEVQKRLGSSPFATPRQSERPFLRNLNLELPRPVERK